VGAPQLTHDASAAAPPSIFQTARETARGRLPPRYAEPWRAPFDALARPHLVHGVRILDAGAGRSPTIPPAARPGGCFYAGLDLSREELDRAGPGAYDEAIVCDITTRHSDLAGRFDLVLSWQVLEHVKPLDRAIENFRSYLRPGGGFVAEMSGTFAVFGLVNQAIPHRAARWLAGRLVAREPDSIFPAHYHRCYYTALQRIGAAWRSWTTVPRYVGAHYFRFAPLLQACYIAYEEWTLRTDHRNLASHYVVSAVK
jgi:SAM-dependent methyltransferase